MTEFGDLFRTDLRKSNICGKKLKHCLLSLEKRIFPTAPLIASLLGIDLLGLRDEIYLTTLHNSETHEKALWH